MKKDICNSCGTKKDAIICLYHKYIVAIHSHLNVVHRNLWSMEVNELSCGKSDALRTIMGQVSEVMNSLENITKQPENYCIDNYLNKE